MCRVDIRKYPDFVVQIGLHSDRSNPICTHPSASHCHMDLESWNLVCPCYIEITSFAKLKHGLLAIIVLQVKSIKNLLYITLLCPNELHKAPPYKKGSHGGGIELAYCPKSSQDLIPRVHRHATQSPKTRTPVASLATRQTTRPTIDKRNIGFSVRSVVLVCQLFSYPPHAHGRLAGVACQREGRVHEPGHLYSA